MPYEENIPTQQAQATEKVRVPRPYENRRRTKSHPKTAPHRPQTPRCLKLFSFPKDRRLVKRADFLRVQREGVRRVGSFLGVEIRWQAARSRLGITASKKYGSSPERNRFKRLVREAYRLHLAHLPPNAEINVFPRQRSKGAKLFQIAEELISLCKS